MSPVVGLGIGLILGCAGWLTTHYPLVAENRRLRIELGKRDRHPALRPVADHLDAQEQAAAPFARHLDAGSADYEAEAIARNIGMRDGLAEARAMRDALARLDAPRVVSHRLRRSSTCSATGGGRDG